MNTKRYLHKGIGLTIKPFNAIKWGCSIPTDRFIARMADVKDEWDYNPLVVSNRMLFIISYKHDALVAFEDFEDERLGRWE